MNKSLTITISLAKGFNVKLNSTGVSSRYMKDMYYLGVINNMNQ